MSSPFSADPDYTRFKSVSSADQLAVIDDNISVKSSRFAHCCY